MNYFRFKLNDVQAFKASDFAIVEVEVMDDKVESTNVIMKGICNAVADWVENSKDGKEMWEENDGEITMRDIADVADMLNPYLSKQGLKNLSIHFDHEFQEEPNDFTLNSNLPVRADKFTDPSDILD